MTIALALGMVALAILLLSLERIPIEVGSLAIVVTLVLVGMVTPEEALAGFSSEAAIFIFALLALTQGLASTGVMQLAGRRLLTVARNRPAVFVVLLLLAVCAFSAVASNTAVTAAFLPVAMASAARLKIPPGRLLMPMAFSSILGGTITLFGTSTNLVVSSAMAEMGMKRIGFLELAPLGLPLAATGIAATLLLTGRLLRKRGAEEPGGELTRREYLTEAILTPGSRFAGWKLRELAEALGVPILGVRKAGDGLSADQAEIVGPDDHLVIAGSRDELLRVKELRSVALRPDQRYAGAARDELRIVEVSVPASSALIGRSVRGIRFAQRYGLLVLGIHRHPTLQRAHRDLDLMRTVRQEGAVRDVPLAAGDVLLVSGRERRLRELARDEDFSLLGEVEYEPPRYHRAAVALVIFGCTVVVAGMRWTSPAIVGLAGMLAMIASGCVSSNTAFRVDWRVVIMIGALLTLGQAMEESGAGEYLARGIVPLAQWVGPRGVLALVMVATVVLSVPMSNQAAALVMLPISVHAGIDLGLDPRTFAIGTCLAASCSLLTPLEPSAALVFGPGRYRFTDFLRVGGPITVLMLVLLAFGVPMIWPFSPR